jgi:hypothetical protein
LLVVTVRHDQRDVVVERHRVDRGDDAEAGGDQPLGRGLADSGDPAAVEDDARDGSDGFAPDRAQHGGRSGVVDPG